MTPTQIRTISADAFVQEFFDNLETIVSPRVVSDSDRQPRAIPATGTSSAPRCCLDIYRLAEEEGVDPFVRPLRAGLTTIPSAPLERHS